jgi:seryl-tRNA synthetase
MLPIQIFRTNRELVLQGLAKRNFKEIELVDAIIEADEQRRKLLVEQENLSASVNQASKQIGQFMAKGDKESAEQMKVQVADHKERIKDVTLSLNSVEEQLHNALVRLPNLPHASVPFGKTPEENEIVRSGGVMPELGDNKVPHWDLMEKYKLMDLALGNKITGSGFPVFMGAGARLQRSLIQYFLTFNTEAGFREYCPPFMVNEDSAYGTGQLPDKEGQMYHVTIDGLYLIPTAEVPLTNIYRDVILTEQEMPVKMTAYSPCFRREAGSYGKDVRGLNRVHQFDKVEIVQMTDPAKSYEALEEMVNHVERLLQSLELPYRILRLCGGDMGFTSALTYDFEVYSAAQERWLEVSSVSNFETFQANRMKIRHRDENGKTQLVHTLNGSSLALPRIIACLLENNQTEAGIKIPAVLMPWFGSDMIS